MEFMNRKGFLLAELMTGLVIVALSASATVVLINSTVSAYTKSEAEGDLLQLRKELINLISDPETIANTLADSHNMDNALACLNSTSIDCADITQKVPIIIRDKDNNVIIDRASNKKFSTSINLPCVEGSPGSENADCPFEIKAYWRPYCSGTCSSPTMEFILEFEQVVTDSFSTSNINPGKFNISRMVSSSGTGTTIPATGASVISLRSSLIFLDDAGGLWATGRNDSFVDAGVGMLGTGRNDKMFPSPIQVLDTNLQPADQGFVTAASYGTGHYCVISGPERSLKCAGSNNHGDLGIGTHNSTSVRNYLVHAQIGGSNAEGIAWTNGTPTGGNIARHISGQYYFWGANLYNRFGTNNYTTFTLGNSKGNAIYSSLTIASDVNAIPEIANSDQIVMGEGSSCALIAPDNSVTCWGHTALGQLGNGSRPGDPISGGSTEIQTPGNQNDKRVLFGPTNARLTDVVSLHAGFNTHCAIVNDTATGTPGRVACWGDGTNGALGNGTDGSIPGPGTVSYNDKAEYVVDSFGNPLSGITNVYVHMGTICAQQGALSQTIYCWGKNDHGQLGQGTVTSHENRAQLLPNPGKPVKQVFITMHMTGVLFTDGTYAGIGRNNLGVFGVGPATVGAVSSTWVHGQLP